MKPSAFATLGALLSAVTMLAVVVATAPSNAGVSEETSRQHELR